MGVVVFGLCVGCLILLVIVLPLYWLSPPIDESAKEKKIDEDYQEALEALDVEFPGMQDSF